MSTKKVLSSVRWPVVVRTRRLELRPYRSSDFALWRQSFLACGPKRNRFDRDPPPPSQLTKARFLKVVRRQQEAARKDEYYVLVIFERKTGFVLGWVDFYVFDRGDAQSANFGYRLINTYWRQGFAKEAALAAARVGFRHLKLQRLEASITPGNVASLELIRSIGFKKECLRRRSSWEDGQWLNQWIYAAIPEDFGRKSRPPDIR